jgi:hypothetical protein
MTKTLLIFGFIFICFTIVCGQNSHELILKYRSNSLISSTFFSGVVTEDIVFYNCLDNLTKKDQFEFVEIITYKKKVRQNRNKIKYHDGILEYNFRRSFWTLPKRTYYFIKSFPTSFFDLFNRKTKANSKIPIAYEKDSLNRIILAREGNWQESYIYDLKNNLIEIKGKEKLDCAKSQNRRICASVWSPTQWNGKYENNNIVEEIINWDNGFQNILRHKWENNILKESENIDAFENKMLTTKYFYDIENDLSRIEYYSGKGNLIWMKRIKWKR